MRRLIFALAGVAVLAALVFLAMLLAGSTGHASHATFVVNATGGASDASPGDGVCETATPGECTLRAAIQEANAHASADTINFSIGTGVQTISPAAALPTITDPVIIDGYTQPGAIANTISAGSNAILKIELDGTNAGNASGLRITAGGSTVKGLAINRFGRNGIELMTIGGNTIEGNFIGTDVSGTADLGNSLDGVRIESASNNMIGGTSIAERNVISGNGFRGVFIIFGAFGSTGNLVQGNLIGTKANGAEALGNTFGGVLLQAHGNILGGTTAGAGNVISGNNSVGVIIFAGAGNQVEGNFIGTQEDGTSPLGNASHGVLISDAPTPNNTIGGTTGTTAGGPCTGACNTIAFNSGDGVFVEGPFPFPVPFPTPPSTGNRILSNSIHSNTGLGIDLDDDGVTTNDVGDGDTGANNLQNFPVLDSAISGSGSTTIEGALNSAATTTFRLEFFSNTACDPSNHGEGESFLGSTTVMTAGSGVVSFTVSFPTTVPAGHFITSTATDPNGNTSEFSQCEQVTLPPLDHFKCYEIEEPPLDQPQDVTLEDQFGAADMRVRGLVSFCNPVDKNGEGINDPTAHLACYRIRGEVGFSPRDVLVENQFGAQSVTVQPQTLCVPSEKDGVSSTDTVTITSAPCTGALIPPTALFTGTPVTVQNGCFEISSEINAPVGSLIGDGINERTFWTFDFTPDPNHLLCIGGTLTSAVLTLHLTPRTSPSTDSVAIRGVAALPSIIPLIQSSSSNPFPTPHSFNIITGELLPNPSSAVILGAFAAPVQGEIRMVYQDDAIVSFAQLDLTCEVPNVLDHFKCYEIEAPPFEQDVTLEDQFGTEDTKVRGLVSLCNPVDKNGEGINDPTAHLACYRIKGELGKRDVLLENQFGAQTVTVAKPETLCVPSFKTP